MNVASAGLASVAARRAQPLKSRFGPLAYGLGAARAALTGRRCPCACASTTQVVFDGGAWQVMVACTGAFGGGSGIGAADATDGDLDVVIIPAGSRIGAGQARVGAADEAARAPAQGAHHEGTVVSVTLPPGTEINWTGSSGTPGSRRDARAAAFAWRARLVRGPRGSVVVVP